MESRPARGRGGKGPRGKQHLELGVSFITGFLGGKGHNVKLSKAMSYLLRHGAHDHGLEMADDGFVKISDLMEISTVKKLKPKFSDILDWVASNDKKRFEIKIVPKSDSITLENGYIRAAQGHTLQGIEEEKLLQKITFPFKYPKIVHGSYSKVLDLIKEQGLSKMARNHIHFAKGMFGEKGVISGMRGSCDIFIEINLGKVIADGIPVYESSNGVILTSGIDGYLSPKYFRKITDKKEKILYETPLDYIVVFDFEAICDKDGNDKFEVQEIIEFPAVIVDCKEKKIVDTFQIYVKPSKYPELTEFWTELTGITQEQVDGGVPIETALVMFHKFLSDIGVLGTEFVLMCWGDYDVKALKREAEYKNLFVPAYLKDWINIKKVFPLHLYKEDKKEILIEHIKKKRPVVKGMLEMLEICELELEGKHHSGIDDSKNIARCVIKTLEDGYSYNHSHIATLFYETTEDKAIEFEQKVTEQ